MTRSDSFYANIWIAGSAADAERLCRDYCNRVGLCVTVTPTVFIYTGGAQSGVLVRLFNYPKFPAERDSIRDKARDGEYVKDFIPVRELVALKHAQFMAKAAARTRAASTSIS